MNNEKFQGIINRIEEVRLREGLGKSRFCKAFGMKPQTYNDFIGKQGSKPNVELILGVIHTYKVDVHWLLGIDNFVVQSGTTSGEIISIPVASQLGA